MFLQKSKEILWMRALITILAGNLITGTAPSKATQLNIGVSYKFGGRKFARYAKVHPVTYESVRYIQPPTKVEVVQPAAEEVVTAFAVRFLIDKYNIEDDQKLNIDRMARYLKRIRKPGWN